MWLLKLTHLILITVSAAVLAAWSYFLTAYTHSLDGVKPFFYFPLVWGGSLALVVLEGIRVRRTLDGRFSFHFQKDWSPYRLSMVAFSCAFTLRLLASVSPLFTADYLDVPYFLPRLFIPLHFALVLWLTYTRGSHDSDRGLFLILLFFTLNGAMYNADYFLILGFACITLLQGIIENRGRFELPPTFLGLPLLLLFLLAVLSSIMGVSPVNSIQALSFVSVSLIVTCLVSIRKRPESFTLKLYAVLLFASSLVILTTLILITKLSEVLGPTPVLTARLSLFHQHPNFLAPYFAMNAFLAFPLILSSSRRLARLAIAFFALVLLAALWLTDSRAGYLGFLAGVAVFCAFMLPLRRWGRAGLDRLGARGRPILGGAGALMLLAVTVLALFYTDPIVTALRENTRLRRAQDYRLDAWANSLEVIKNNPLHGIGMNNFVSLKKFPPGSKFSHELNAPHPHNLFLYVAQSCGLPALIVFLALLGGYFAGSMIIIRRLQRSRLRMLTIGGLAASVTLLACGVVDLGLSLVTLFPGPMWLFIGISASIYNSHVRGEARAVRLDGLKAVLPALGITGVVLYGAVFPMVSRIWMLKAQFAEQEYRPEESIKFARSALSADPLYTGAKAYLLRHYLRKRDYDEALTLIEEATRLEPRNSGFHLLHGDILCLLQEHEKALEKYRLAVEVDHGSPKLPEYSAKLIALEARCGYGEEARAHLKESIMRNIAVINLIPWKVTPLPEEGRNDQFLTIGDTGETLHLDDLLDEIHGDLQDASERGIPQDRFNWFSLFQAYKNALNYDRALNVLDDIESIFQEREEANVQFQRALIAKEKEDLGQSEALLKMAGDIGDANNPGAAMYYETHRSEVLLEDENLEEAIRRQREILASLRDFQTFRSTFVNSLNNLIRAYLQGERNEELIPPLKQRIFFSTTREERFSYLVDLAMTCRKVKLYRDAEEALVDAIDSVTSNRKRSLRDMEDPRARGGIERAAYELADLYREMGHSPEQALKRAWHKTDLFSSDPARILFRCHFLMRTGLFDRAGRVLDLTLMDDDLDLVLLELRAECYYILDDLDGLHQTSQAIFQAYQAHGIDLETRCIELFTAVFADHQNIPLILELVRVKSYLYKLDHCLNVLREALKVHPNEPSLYFLAGRIHRMNNEPDKALESLEKALELDPTNLETAAALRNLRMHLGKKTGGSDG